MEVNKVTFGGNTLIDLTEDTVTEDTLLEGATAHNSKGERIEGKRIAGDMFKDTYDTDGNGKVDNADNADKLGGNSPDYYASKEAIPTKVSQLDNDKGYLTEHQSLEGYAKTKELPTKVSQLENDEGYLKEHQSLEGYAKKDEIPVIPTKVSEFENDKGYLTEHQDLSGYAKREEIPVVPTKVSSFENDKGYLTEHQSLEDYARKDEIPSIPSKVSAFENDKGYLVEETDPTVPSWAKDPNKPVYNAEEVGADEKGTAVNTTSAHNTDTDAHSDIRLLIQGLIARLDTVANSSDKELDQLSEIVAYIKNNKSLIDGVTTSKVNVADIVNNLTTNVDDKPLSASQGVVLKAFIDAITVPTKVSQLENDRGYLTQHQSLADYAKKSEIPTIPSNISAFNNDVGYAKKTEIPSIPSSLPANGGNADTVCNIGLRIVTDINDPGMQGYMTVII